MGRGVICGFRGCGDGIAHGLRTDCPLFPAACPVFIRTETHGEGQEQRFVVYWIVILSASCTLLVGCYVHSCHPRSPGRLTK